MSARIADVLDEAAEVIRRNGLHKGDYYDRDQLDGDRTRKDCPVCAHGAMNLAASGNNPDNDYHPDGEPAVDALYRWLWDNGQQVGYVDGSSIPSWNDAPERTAEEVIAALNGAAAAVRAKAGAA